MKKFLLVLSVVVFGLVACNSTPKNPIDATPGRTADVEFLEANGPLTLTFDDKGNWVSIKSSATAPLVNNAPEGVEIAFKTATMRAKRNLTEFMANDVKSTKSVQTISKSYLKNIAQVDSSNESKTAGEDEDAASNSQATKESRQKANTIAQTVRERIDDNAQAILRGVQVTERKVSKEQQHVSVTIVVTQQSIRGAEQVRKAMGN
jgi:hypothetical protein